MKKTKKILKKLLIFSTILVNLMIFSSVHGEESKPMDDFNVKTYLTAEDQQHGYFKTAETQKTSPIGAFLLDIISYMLLVIGTICIGIIIIGGFFLITAQGNENQVEKGKNAITYALIGLVIAFSSYTISVFVQSLLYTNV